MIGVPDLLLEDSPRLLLHLAEVIGARSMLVPTHDLFVDLISRHRTELAPWYRLELPDPASLEFLRNKARFAVEATRRGWTAPPTVLVEAADGLERASAELRFPVILKPAFGNLAFRSNSAIKAKLCNNPRELRAAHAEFSQWEPELIVQEFIPGGDDALYFTLHYHDSRLSELGCFTGRKLRQWPPLCGNTSLAEPAAVPELAATSGAMLRELGCVGFGSIEYKRDPRDGRCYVIEPTVGRPDHQIGIAIANGVDLATRAYGSLTGAVLRERRGPSRPRKWIFLREDFCAATAYRQAGTLTAVDYLRSLRGRMTGALWRPADWRLYPSLALGFLRFAAELVRSRVPRYSLRSVRAGSTRVARRAGIPPATSTTTPNSSATIP